MMEKYQDPDELFLLAEMANTMDRQDDVIEFLHKLIKKNPHLDDKARTLFASASKYEIGRVRQSLRIVSWYSRNDLGDDTKEVVMEYLDKIGKELVSLCRKILKIIEDELIPHAADIATKVFYLKLRGDYYRYITEFDMVEDREQVIEDAGKAYSEGMELANGLSAKDYHRLGLALSYSVYHYEVCNAADKACELAQKTLTDGQEALNSNPEDSEDCEGVLQLLRDNLSIWKNEKDC